MGIVKMPYQRMHWIKRTLIKSGIKYIMSRDRFEFIEKYFLQNSQNDINQISTSDPYHKIRYIIDYFKNKF